MAERTPPYFDMQPHQVAQAILQNPAPTLKALLIPHSPSPTPIFALTPSFMQSPQLYSSEFIEFLRFCLQKDTRKRFSAATLETVRTAPYWHSLTQPHSTLSTNGSPKPPTQLSLHF